MAFDIISTHPQNATTKKVLGQTCNAYLASRFADPTTAPATNTAPPGSADAGPVTSVGTAGAVGQFTFSAAAANFVPYMVSYTDPNDAAATLYWLGPITPVTQTAVQPFPVANNQQDNRPLGWSTLDASMQTLVLPQSSIKVASTASMLSSGNALIAIATLGAHNNNYQSVKYTSTDATHLLGCTGGTGTINLVNGIVMQAYINGSVRRRCRYTLLCTASLVNDVAAGAAVCDSGGLRAISDAAGIYQWPVAQLGGIYAPLIFDVDPGGAYGIYPNLAGNGAVSIWRAMEVDG